MVAESCVGNVVPQDDVFKNKQQQFKQWAEDSGANCISSPVTSNETQQSILAELKDLQTLLGNIADLYIPGPYSHFRVLAGMFAGQIDDKLIAIHRVVGLPAPTE
ncbi:hypothetical protein NM208_g8246 [Fusarium decemcellulare]|uniref:Uncharacterized protein n=1 Tax=Fusarium decemcellulare TaxID=57161 RepID=A0ACC1S672_9HYPO|nr:hypothetical protein NM208_g8246 [Fusarium decemcellulare]